MCCGNQTRAGFVVLAGRPNVGKSTLLNVLLGEKIAIVSAHPQTTRNRILGVKTVGAAQMVIVDTPGIHRARNRLNRFMVREALAAVEGVDCVVLVAEVVRSIHGRGDGGTAGGPHLHEDDRYALQQVQKIAPEVPVIVAVNKIDLLRDRRALLPLMAHWQQAGFLRIVPISALANDGIDRLTDEILATLPRGPHLYPEDMITDRAERFLAAELIREQVFRQSREEVPYSTAVEIDRFDERPDRGDVCIAATIYVERTGQLAIVIGHHGRRIKEVGTQARMAIAQHLGCTVHLKLTVRVAPDWTHAPEGRQRFGYE